MLGRLIEKLVGTGRPLIIDEAHQLSPTGLELVRDLHDETGCPVILAGTLNLNQSVDDGDVFFGQFSSRVALRYNVCEDLAARPGDGGPQPLHSMDEIRRLCESDKVRFTDDAPESRLLLTKIANRPRPRRAAAVCQDRAGRLVGAQRRAHQRAARAPSGRDAARPRLRPPPRQARGRPQPAEDRVDPDPGKDATMKKLARRRSAPRLSCWTQAGRKELARQVLERLGLEKRRHRPLRHAELPPPARLRPAFAGPSNIVWRGVEMASQGQRD